VPHTINGRVCAWIEPRGEAFEAAFVCLPLGQVEVVRKPATKRCASEQEAKQWIERETAALGFPIEWVEGVGSLQFACRLSAGSVAS
jgi:hypothetical protein